MVHNTERYRGILGLIERWQCADRPAIVVPDGGELSYSELLAKAQSVANKIQESSTSINQRFAIPLRNSPDAVATFLGVISCYSSAPLNPALSERELVSALKGLEVSGLAQYLPEEFPLTNIANHLSINTLDLTNALTEVTTGLSKETVFDELYDAANQFLPSSAALLLSTSGTTAKPKIVSMTQEMLVASAENVRQTLTLSDQDRYLSVMPLFHIHGLATLLGALGAGNTVVLPERFRASDFVDILRAYEPSWYSCAPTIHQAILFALAQQPELRNHTLRFARSASAPLPIATYEQLERVLKIPVVEFYGMTEATDLICSNSPQSNERKPGSVGKPVPGVVLKIQESLHKPDNKEDPIVGQILIRGKTVIKDYEKDESGKPSFDNGWFCTGDLGYLDAVGNLFIRGRVKEIINRGGEKISPVEIDNVLLRHPAVRQAVAFAVPHSTLGEVVAAAIVLKKSRDATTESILQYCRQHLAFTKVPTRLIVLDQIHATASGKPQRFLLSNEFGKLQGKSYVAPRTDEEKRLCFTVQFILQVTKVGIADDFFDLGGDSMTAVLVVEELNHAGFDIDFEQFAMDSTIERLAASMKVLESEAPEQY